MEFSHRTVLLRETVELLAPDPGKLFLDGTLGGGLYGVGVNPATGRSVLLTIDTQTGAGHQIGPTGVESLGFGNAVADISFRPSDGQLPPNVRAQPPRSTGVGGCSDMLGLLGIVLLCVMFDLGPALGDVPKYPGWIDDKGDT